MLENELKNILAKTIADTSSSDVNFGKMSNVSTTYEPIKIKFNRSYFITLKLFEDILAKQYKEERDALFVNEALMKFCYLGQVFLNCLCIHATLYPENPNYYSFELGIFYLALVNLAIRYKFTTLVLALEKIYAEIFNPNDANNIALIITNVDEFKKRFNSEIILFEQQFILHYKRTIKNKTTYKTHLSIQTIKVNCQQLLHRLVNTKLHSYQQQLLLKFMGFINIDPIRVSKHTKNVIDDFTKSININDSENDKKNKLTKACQEYEAVLDTILKEEERPNQVSNYEITQETITAFPENYDRAKLALHFIYLINVDFSKANFSKVVGCHFEDCVFSDDNFKNTQFINCSFYNCDFRGCTLTGTLNNCNFTNCNFTGAYFDWLILEHCIFTGCNLNETQWYRVKSCGLMLYSSLINAAIRFSNLEDTEFFHLNLTNTSFEGSRINLISSSENVNWSEAKLDDALYLSKLSATTFTYTDHLFAQIENNLIRLFGAGTNCTNLLISSSDITTKLNQFIQDEAPVHMKNYGASFKLCLGWIFCAIDRLTEFCEQFNKNKLILICNNSLTNFEILVDTLKTAIYLFRVRYLTLNDRCHLNLMTSLLSNGLFNNYQQYQDAISKKIPTLPHSIFADNERVAQDNDPDNRDPAKFKKRESLMVVQKLPAKLKEIEKTFSEMRQLAQKLQNLLSNRESATAMLRNAIEQYRLNHGP